MYREDNAMPLTIPDETLRAAGMSEREAKVEIACRWFDAGKLSLGHAAGLAELSESEFEAELELRGIPRYRYTEEMLAQDVEALKKLGRW
jgi:predicted HTH domain antitoxin